MKNAFASLVMLLIAVATFSAFTPSPVTESASVECISKDIPVGGAYLMFAGKNGGNIKQSELRGETELEVDGCARGSRIFSFTLEVNHNGKTETLQAKSNTLSQEMIAALSKLRVGESFQFKSTKAYMPNGKDVVDVRSEKFTVV